MYDFQQFTVDILKGLAAFFTSFLVWLHIKQNKEIDESKTDIALVKTKVNRMETYLCLLLDHNNIKYHKPEDTD